MNLTESIRRYYEQLQPKYITWDFYEKYIDIEPPFGQLGLPVFLRTYSRHIESEKRREKWMESVLRNVEFSIGLDGITSHDELKKEAEELFDYIFNLRTFPSGRALWVAGSKQTEVDPSSVWNCTFRTIDSLSAFSEIFYWLLIGAGCGFSVEEEYVNQLPSFFNNDNKPIKHVNEDVWIEGYKDTLLCVANYKEVVTLTKQDLLLNDGDYFNVLDIPPDALDITVVVGDSKEGWSNALRAYLTLLTIKRPLNITFNYKYVRPKGVPLKTFGGRASGCGNLIDLFNSINDTITNRKLTSVDCLDIVCIVGRAVVSGGVRRCLPEDTLVHLQKGLTKIKDVKVGDMVATSKGYYPVTDWVEQGLQETVKIKTQLGEFECTPKHRIAVFTSPTEYVFKHAKDLTSEDMMVFVDNIVEGVETKLPSFEYVKPLRSTTCKDIIIPELTEDIAYFFGYFHGNGYVTLTSNDNKGDISLVVPVGRESTRDKLIKICEKFGVNVSYLDAKEDDQCYKIRVSSKQLAIYLSQFKTANANIEVPNFVLNGNVEIRTSYLAGLMEADGYFTGRPLQIISTVYPIYAKEIQCLFASLGIATVLKKHREAAGNWKALYHLNLKGRKFTNKFNEFFAHKIDRYEIKTLTKDQSGYGFPTDMILNSGLKINYKLWSKNSKQMTFETYEKTTGKIINKIPIKVINVELTKEKKQTYDISVDSVNEFICDAGYLVHNTALICLGGNEDDAFKIAKYDLWSDPAKQKYTTYRTMSNNSIAAKAERPKREQLTESFEVIKSNGEPGFWIVGNAQKYDPKIIGTNPCGESGMRNQQSCNLTTNNVVEFVRYDDNLNPYLDEEEWRKSLYLSTRIGTRVTLLPQWHPEWDKVQKSQRLLGVSMTGLMDAVDLLGWNEEQLQDFFVRSRLYVREVADEYSDALGIERSARISLFKPEGSVSQLPTVSSGIHRAYSPHYIRRVRFSSIDPLATALLDIVGEDNVKPENGQGDSIHGENVNTWVFTFPIKTAAKIRAIDEPAISQLERYLLAQTSYTADGHNTSVTVTVAPEEWDEVEQWVYDNWSDIIGVSFLPKFDPEKETYPQMPYEPCQKDKYDELYKLLPTFNENQLISLISKYEDNYDEYGILEDACASGSCPLR